MFEINYLILLPILVALILFGLSFISSNSSNNFGNLNDNFGNLNDNFGNLKNTINSLKIKYNDEDVIIPKNLEVQENKNQSVLSELKSQPLAFTKQIYSSNKYPFVGEPELCTSNEHCTQITAECKNNKYLGLGTLGTCGLSIPNKTVFDIDY